MTTLWPKGPDTRRWIEGFGSSVLHGQFNTWSNMHIGITSTSNLGCCKDRRFRCFVLCFLFWVFFFFSPTFLCLDLQVLPVERYERFASATVIVQCPATVPPTVQAATFHLYNNNNKEKKKSEVLIFGWANLGKRGIKGPVPVPVERFCLSATCQDCAPPPTPIPPCTYMHAHTHVHTHTHW